MVNFHAPVDNPRVLAALEGYKMEEMIGREFGPDYIKSKLLKIAKSNIADYIEWGPNGIKVLPSSNLSREQTANIVKVTQRTSRYGMDITVEIERPLEAIRELARIQGMYKDHLTVKDPIQEELENLSDEEIHNALTSILCQNPELAQVMRDALPGT